MGETSGKAHSYTQTDPPPTQGTQLHTDRPSSHARHTATHRQTLLPHKAHSYTDRPSSHANNDTLLVTGLYVSMVIAKQHSQVNGAGTALKILFSRGWQGANQGKPPRLHLSRSEIVALFNVLGRQV